MITYPPSEVPEKATCGHENQVAIDEGVKRLWSELEHKLLSIGGKRLVWRGCEPHLQQLVTAGQLFDVPVERHKMTVNNCHGNAAKLWAEDVKGTRLVTGYALSRDVCMWLQHSWVLKNGRLWETTSQFQKYFGVELDEMDSLRFLFSNVDMLDKANIGAFPGVLPIITKVLKSHGHAAPDDSIAGDVPSHVEVQSTAG